MVCVCVLFLRPYSRLFIQPLPHSDVITAKRDPAALGRFQGQPRANVASRGVAELPASISFRENLTNCDGKTGEISFAIPALVRRAVARKTNDAKGKTET